MIPTLPQEAKPYERAILYAYSQGIRTPAEIARLLSYKTKRPVEKCLRRYRDDLPDLVVIQPMGRLIGNGLIVPSMSYSF